MEAYRCECGDETINITVKPRYTGTSPEYIWCIACGNGHEWVPEPGLVHQIRCHTHDDEDGTDD